MTKSNLAADMLGVEKAYVYTGRIARTVRKKGEFNQLAITGVLLSQDEQDYEGGDWERIDCDVIIVPKGRFDLASNKGARIDQVAMMLGNDDYWKKKV